MQPLQNENGLFNISDTRDENAAGIPLSLHNPHCTDDPGSFNGTCKDIQELGGEGCENELFTDNDVPTDNFGRLVITVGSRYCPETCNAVSQCLRARERFISIHTKKSSFVGVHNLYGGGAEYDKNGKMVDVCNVTNSNMGIPTDRNDITVPIMNGSVPAREQQIHFRTYGNDVYSGARKRIVKEANDTGWFTTAKYWTPEDLGIEFREKYKDLLALPRGGGYWVWKFFVIEQTIEHDLLEGDFLVFLDAGSQINKGGEMRFYEYIKMVNESQYDMLGLQIPGPEHRWTTNRLFDAFDVTSDDTQIKHSGQVEANTLLFQKGHHYRNWMKLCKCVIDIDPWMLTDKYNEEARRLDPEFKENRHDQSIMSVARKKLGFVVIDGRESKNAQPDKPFHVMRKRD